MYYTKFISNNLFQFTCVFYVRTYRSSNKVMFCHLCLLSVQFPFSCSHECLFLFFYARSMKILQAIPDEYRNQIAVDHIVVGAALLDEHGLDTSFTTTVRENLYDCAIHILQKNTDGSVHNGDILQANFEAISELIDDINLLERSIQDDLQKIPNFTGVFFTKAKSQFVSLFD